MKITANNHGALEKVPSVLQGPGEPADVAAPLHTHICSDEVVLSLHPGWLVASFHLAAPARQVACARAARKEDRSGREDNKPGIRWLHVSSILLPSCVLLRGGDALHCITFSSTHSYIPAQNAVYPSIVTVILTLYVAGCRRESCTVTTHPDIWPRLLFRIRFRFPLLSTPPSLPPAPGPSYAALLSCIDWRRDGGVGHVPGGHQAGIN